MRAGNVAVRGLTPEPPNSLNQYETITTGSTRTAAGRAPVDWTVLVNDVAASRIGEIFHQELTASNATAPVWQDVVIRRDTGTPSMTQHFWVAEANFEPGYTEDGILNNHDADGNLTDDGRWTYLWDAENRLIQMESTTQATAAGHPYTKLQFVYDWQGRRIARHVWQGGTQANPTFKSSRRWLYDGWNVITEFSAPSATSTTLTRLNTFTWGLDLGDQDGIPRQRAGGVGGLLVQTAVSGGVIERASYDGNGNIVAWTKSNASAPTSRREYDAFGNTLVSEGTTPSAFGFSTKMQDGETGLYYYGYRFYDPVTGRWLSRDPIEEKGGRNLYAFVGNRSIEQTDYLGLKLSRHSSSDFNIGPGNPIDRGYTIARYPQSPFVRLPDLILKFVKVQVLIEGDIEIDSEKMGADDDYGEWHERHHIDVFVKKWNMLASEINYLERKWCRPCHSYAVAYGQAAARLRINESAWEQYYFDTVECPIRNAPKDQIDAAKRGLDKTDKERKVIVKEYNDAGAKFYKQCLNGVKFVPEDKNYNPGPLPTYSGK